MRLSLALQSATYLFANSVLVSSQTHSTCNPLSSGTCPPDPALGKSLSVDFTKGASNSFTSGGTPAPSYGQDGVTFSVAKDGDSPLLISNWYIMFGRVEITLQAAPGTGIVSSAVLESDDLDEIDLEWLGGDDQSVQSNYFSKGNTGAYNRGAMHAASQNHDGFTTYAIDWSAEQIIWYINGAKVRALASSSVGQNNYPQTPMKVKIGAWCGGCPSNTPGTIQWAGGLADFSNEAYTMKVKSINVQDYSTGTLYKYKGSSGNWQDIEAVGGNVNDQSTDTKGNSPASPSASIISSPEPVPFQGTHSDKSSGGNQPNAGGWSPTSVHANSASLSTTYPDLPPGWVVTDSGKVLPPSAAAGPVAYQVQHYILASILALFYVT